MNKRLTIFVSSPDSYSDVFKVFLDCINLNWHNRPYDIVLSTNTMRYDNDNIVVINNGCIGDDWVHRSIPVLERIDTKYVLLMCDDIMINKNVKNEEIEWILDFMEEEKIDFCRLKPIKKGKKINDLLEFLPRRMPYALNLQIGIFNRQYLLSEIMKENTDAWGIERRWVQQTLCAEKTTFSNVIGVRRAVVPFIHGVVKGKWFPSAVKKLRRMGVLLNYPTREIHKVSYEFIVNIKGIANRLLPISFQHRLKMTLGKLGMNFET